MEAILSTLSECTRRIAADCETIKQCNRSIERMGQDVMADMQSRGHVEFSLFNPNGKF